LKKCQHCGIETANPKFCTRVCAVIYNNIKFPRRKKKPKSCTKCRNKFFSNRDGNSRYTCSLCRRPGSNGYGFTEQSPGCWEPRTIGSVRAYFRNRGQYHRSGIHAMIRSDARRLHRKPGDHCSICGYDKHVEIAHRQPLSGFPDSALLSKINSLENILKLCPNCHWEFDHGLLKR